MSTIDEFIRQNLGRGNVTPRWLMLEAYALGVAHGKGETYESVPEEEVEEDVDYLKSISTIDDAYAEEAEEEKEEEEMDEGFNL